MLVYVSPIFGKHANIWETRYRNAQTLCMVPVSLVSKGYFRQSSLRSTRPND